MMNEGKIIFVYNAESDLKSRLFDYAHKVLSPRTYKCELCALTHSNFGEREAWKNFRKESLFNFMFMYVNEFEKKYDKSFDYPIIGIDDKDGIRALLTRSEISQLNDISELIEFINSRLISNKTS